MSWTFLLSISIHFGVTLKILYVFLSKYKINHFCHPPSEHHDLEFFSLAPLALVLCVIIGPNLYLKLPNKGMNSLLNASSVTDTVLESVVTVMDKTVLCLS